MSRAPDTPRSKVSAAPTTPVMARVGSVVQSSPHYTTTRRHSLYGTEDRIILDAGSRVWKVGFSGEGRPRDVFFAAGGEGASLWSLSRPHVWAEREQETHMLEARIQERLRFIFHESLLTDPKSRKVIIVENPLLPLYVKDMIARILFNNLQVPSISFVSSHLLSLLAVGRITGLVLDCGYLESVALPIFAARPLYSQLRTTPLAGSRLTSHLRALLLMFGTYMPPPSSLGSSANIPAASRSTRVPEDVLTDAVMEEIKTRCCLVGDALDTGTRGASPTPGDAAAEPDVPPSDSSQPGSDFSLVSMDVDGAPSPAASGFSAASPGRAPPGGRAGPGGGEGHLQALMTMYRRHSAATDVALRVEPPAAQQTGTGRGTLIVPGWIRERGADVLFEGGDVDESSVAEVILDALLKVPVDLRKTLASSILVVGGTPMLPGFIPRLHAELLRALTRMPPSRQPVRPDKPAPPVYDPYAPLRPLSPHIAILNNPSPPPSMSGAARTNAGKAPAFMPVSLPWVGGSLAGSLKIGGEEIVREKWDEADAADEEGEENVDAGLVRARSTDTILPDWTRMPLGPGAPPVPRPAPVVAASRQAAVGA